jgi:hypothetical protein
MAGRRVPVQCVGPSYPLADRKSAAQRSVNLWVQQIEGPGEDVQAVLRSAPGLVRYLDLGATIRGLFATDSRWFAVAGSTLYELTSGAAVSRGTLTTSSGYVRMKDGRDQLCIVDGTNGYVLTLSTNAFVQITDGDFRPSTWVDELDGYFIFATPNSDQFFISDLDNATSFDSLDFSSADAQNDNIVTFRVAKRELFLFGTRSVEVWIDSGNPDFPFTRYNSTPIDIGIVGARAAIKAADTLVFCGQTERGTGVVYMLEGHQPTVISTQAVEEALAGSSDLSQCSMWVYQREGNEFVGINAPGLETTWVWDAATRQWHERAEGTDAWVPLRLDEVVCFGGTHYGSAGQYVYELDDDAFVIEGTPVVRERTWPHLRSPSLEPMPYRGLELLCTTGHGGQISLEISNDGGETFGNRLMRSLGTSATQRVRWLCLGSARDRVFRLRCADAVPLSIIAATVDA